MQTSSSKILDDAVAQLSHLPSIGRRSAMRLALYLLRQDKADVEAFLNSIKALRDDVKYCRCCHNISDTDECSICSNSKRDHKIVCVVESIRDVMAIESTQQFSGVYHVLGGVISPMDGVGPEELEVDSLERRVASGEIDELILALSTTMEGDTTCFYLYRRLSQYGVRMTTIARGVAIGDELEYADELTLGRSIVNRVVYEGN
ncbi:MAG: recombination protein RecR [Marinilabiliaceae bacterium]|nr:recombination protein RecR [Marinilabiliaceae bacterium]